MYDLIPYVFASVGGAGLVAAMFLMWREMRARPVYVPRHRAIDGPSTMQQVTEMRRRAALPAATQAAELLAGLGDGSADQKELDRPGPVKGSYAKLRTDDLDSTAERFWRLVDRGIRPPSPWGTPSTVDEWDPMPVGVDGYAIAGRTR